MASDWHIALGRSLAICSPPTAELAQMYDMMSGFTRLEPVTGPRLEPRSVVAQAAVPSQLQSMKRLSGLATSLPPTEMMFLAVPGDPKVEAPVAPELPAETVTTKLGLLKRAVSSRLACESYVSVAEPHELFWMNEPLAIAAVIEGPRSAGGLIVPALFPMSWK